MDIITWQNYYSVGVEVIDNQHKELVRLLNDLVSAMSEGKGNEKLHEILLGLTDYATKHFDTEEQLMNEYNYPGREMHILEHAKLKKQVKSFLTDYQAGKGKITIELMQYLSNWIREHIQQTDRDLGKFLQSKKPGSEM